MPPGPSVPLHSDHVNYLIWRYLQEQGYGHAAVHLSRAWNNDPQNLPFAHDVKPHDLVSVIQDGIMFDELSSNVESRDRRYQFTAERNDHAASDSPGDPNAPRGGDTAHLRRRPRVAEPKPKQSNNIRAATESSRDRHSKGSSHRDAEDTEADQNGNLSNDADVVMEDAEPLVSTLSMGTSKGIQNPAVGSTLASLTLPDTDIMDMCWSPSGALVVSGGSLWRSWPWSSLVQSSNPDTERESVPLEPSNKSFYVSAAEKDPKTGYIASAFADDDTSAVFVDFNGAEPRRALSTDFGGVSLLRWNAANHNLLVVCHRPQGEEVSTWDVQSSEPLAVLQFPHVIEDITWKDNTEVVMVGSGFLDSSDSLLWNSDPSNGRRSITTDVLWAFVKYDHLTQACACVAPNQGIIAFVPSSRNEHAIRSQAFHSGQITAIEWGESQRYESALNSNHQNGIQSNGHQEQAVRLLISASTDGSIMGWNALQNLDCLFAIDMGSNIPVMTLSMQNEYLAAAGNGKVSAWKITWQSQTTQAMACPKPDRMVVWYVPKEPTEDSENDKIGWPVDESPFHKLSWKPSDNFWMPSERVLAYSTGNQVHVIDLPP